MIDTIHMKLLKYKLDYAVFKYMPYTTYSSLDRFDLLLHIRFYRIKIICNNTLVKIVL